MRSRRWEQRDPGHCSGYTAAGGCGIHGVKVFSTLDEGLRDADVVVTLRLQKERMEGALLPVNMSFTGFTVSRPSGCEKPNQMRLSCIRAR